MNISTSDSKKKSTFIKKTSEWLLLKQPIRGVLRKRYSENMKQIYRRALIKSHFDVGVLLSISCIFSKHLFLRTLMLGNFLEKQID